MDKSNRNTEGNHYRERLRKGAVSQLSGLRQAFLGWQYPRPTGAMLGIDHHQTKAYALA